MFLFGFFALQFAYLFLYLYASEASSIRKQYTCKIDCFLLLLIKTASVFSCKIIIYFFYYYTIFVDALGDVQVFVRVKRRAIPKKKSRVFHKHGRSCYLYRNEQQVSF